MMRCPQCDHPMMDCEGVVRPKRGSGDHRTADWYCMNCHHVVWTPEQSVPPTTEKETTT